jgi:hypothetical protein
MADTVVAGHVGVVYSADGTENAGFRQDAHGAIVNQPAGSSMKEAVKRGNVYNGQTAATGVAPGTALGTTSAFTLYNPVGSGKYFILHKITLGLISGTLGAGVVHVTAGPTTDAVPTGTAITPKNRLIGAANNSVATVLTTATVTTQAAKQIDIVCSLNEGVIATTAINNELIEKRFDGDLVIGPGCAISLQATAAGGSSPLVVFNCVWEEEPIAA